MKRIIVIPALLVTLSLACSLGGLTGYEEVTSDQTVIDTPTSITVNSPTSAYITFAVNVHDWAHTRESADILLKLVDLFEKYGVRGDFYFTAEVSRKLAEEHPHVDRTFQKFGDDDQLPRPPTAPALHGI